MGDGGRMIQVPEGSQILTEGELNLDMYKIVSGHAEVYTGFGTDTETLIGIIGPGACFGEFGMLLEKPAIYTVIAYSDMLLLRITKGELGDFVQQNHKNIVDIMQNMAQTMMTMRTQIDLLITELSEGKKPDETQIHDMRKQLRGYAVYKNVGMKGKFHTLDMIRDNH